MGTVSAASPDGAPRSGEPPSFTVRPCCQPRCIADNAVRMSSGERLATLSPDAADGVLLGVVRSRSCGARLACRTRFGRPL